MSKDKTNNTVSFDDSKILFLEKLKLACSMTIELWEDRKLKPNLSISEFLLVVPHISEDVVMTWAPRASKKGSNASTAEEHIFKFEFEMESFGKKKRYFVKGYFFDKSNLRGVTIQSFREITLTKLISIKGHKQ